MAAKGHQGSLLLNFKRQHGLLDCVDSSSSLSPSPSKILRSDSVVSRTTTTSNADASASSRSSTGDIDKRAEMFINNFYRHIKMERQVSLELRYCKGNNTTLERSPRLKLD